MDYELFEVKLLMHQDSELSLFLFAVVVDVVKKFARHGALSELLYADDLVLMSETIKGLRNKLLKWKETLGSKGLKGNHGKTRAMVVVVDPTPPTCCQQSPTPESCGSQQSPPQVARKGSTLSGFVQRSRLEREVGRDLHSNKWEEV